MKIKYAKEILAVCLFITASIALYYTFSPVPCKDFTCFQSYMTKCKPASFLNEEPQASWQYLIRGTGKKSCEIQVTLLSAKEGDLGLREYEGASMICFYPIGNAGYPEKNLAACHGPLKEGLQQIVIEKLYRLIRDNLGDLREQNLF